jgi:hypothetical protein
VISRRLAMTMFGTTNVIGRGYPKSKPERTIVGVAEDARAVQLEFGGGQQYTPHDWKAARSRALVIRAKANVTGLTAPLKDAALAQSQRFVPEVRLVKTQYTETLSERRNFAIGVNALSCLTLLLATLGIFSVISYGINLRRKEIGIRIALGGQGWSLLTLLLRQLALPVAGASGLGMALGFIITKTIETQNPNASTLIALDPVLLVAVVGIVAVAVVVATIVPVRRAFRIDVLESLRHE